MSKPDFLRTDPDIKRALKEVIDAEKRLRERDHLGAHLHARLVSYAEIVWVRIDDDAGNPHIIEVGSASS